MAFDGKAYADFNINRMEMSGGIVEYGIFDKIRLKDGTLGTIVDRLGPDYVVDIGTTNKEYDTVLVKIEEIAAFFDEI